MISRGSRVLVPGMEHIGTVLEAKNGFARVSINSQVSWHPMDDLTDISDQLLSRLVEGDMDSPLRFILAVDANRLMTKYRFDPYVLASSTRITVYPHQINEVAWGIDNQRIMIADEVGLGKTIIAALIVNELKARGLADRVMYVVPKSLVLKWQDELLTKFETEAEILDSNYVKFNRDPFSSKRYDYVTSMDFLKHESRRPLIKKLDMVVVDEAHKFKPGSERYKLGEVLSERADSMIFLTATPHDGKDKNFLGRMRLLDPFVADVSSTAHLWRRHIKEDVVDIDGRQVFPRRTSTTVDTELTNNERAIYRMLDEYVRNRRAEAHNPQDMGAMRLLAILLEKRAASSLRSLRSTLERRRERIGTVKIKDVTDPDDMDNDGDYEDRAEKYEYFWTGADKEQERRNISEIIAAIDQLGDVDSKFDKLVKFIEKVKSGDINAKVLLFTEYRDTVDYLEGRLGGRYRTGRIDGTMGMQSRKAALEEFSRNDGPEIFLCTDAAGEGVDMQFCNVEFNYDMPWNPNRLEQRMGRIHRIGQRRKVRYYNFVVDKENTIDGMIHDLLLDKIDKIKTAMGDSVFDILGRIIGEDMIRKIYEELQALPRDGWKPRIMAELDEIDRTRESVKQKIGDLLEGHRLDRTILEDIKKIKMRAIDAGDIRRFLETWTEFNDGKYEERGSRVHIRAPVRMASKIGGVLDGTLDVAVAQRLNIKYLALGNRKVQAILADAMENGSVASLGHAKKSGLLCIYNRSVMDGDERKRDSETVAVFCNEDGVAEVVDVDSVWDYEEADTPCMDRKANPNLLVKMKELADERIADDSKKFHDKTAKKLGRMRRKAREAVDSSVAAEIEVQNEKIKRWNAKKHTAPHYANLISGAERKNRKKKREGDKRKAELDRRFTSRLQIDLVGLATVTPRANANARTMSDRAGMEIVLGLERKRAKTARDRDLVRDVSNRDKGYDIETSDRSIEVKSFEGYPNPSLTSHEWLTAEKFGDRYWLYVVENVHDGGDVTEIQNPYRVLADVITRETHTVDTYSFSWAKWKRNADSATKT